MDSDSDDEGSTGNGFGMDLTGILFGNIDSEGKLVDDDENGTSGFDAEIKEHLGSLGKMGLSSLLNEVISTDVEESGNKEEKDEPLDEFDALKADQKSDNSGDDDEDGEIVKDVNAIDYSDINEYSEDCPRTPPATTVSNSDEVEDLEDAIPATKLEIGGDKKDDKELMPPPTLPLRGQASNSTDNSTTVKSGSDDTTDSSTNGSNDKIAERKLDTPLADMLPSKYANVDVRELFPDFRPDKVLRFSRLFGPGKPSSLPQIWRHVRKRRRKRKQSRDTKIPNTGSDSHSDSEEPRRRGFGIHYGPDPTPEQCLSDDEDKLLRISNNNDIKKEGPENGDSSDSKPKIADWRYGPAQIWYDMLEVPDSGDGFNYGFKTKSSQTQNKKHNDEDEANTYEDAVADDAFLMVSQLHWEDEVVWDGNDIKAKVMQKLHSKTNAAGWLPSSGSRTAGAFSQPGKTLPVTGAPTGKMPSSNQTTSGKQKANQILQSKPAEAIDDTWYSIFPVENEELIYGKWEDEIIWDAEQMSKVPKPKVLTLDPNDENIILGIPDDIDPSKINKNTGPPPKIKIPHPHVKKSKILLGKAGVINVLAEDTPPPPPKSPDRDPFNISNDSYYQPKTEPTLRLKAGGGNLIQHSTPVVELRAPFIPTHMGPMKLRAFHRPALKKYSYGPISDTGPHPVLPLVKNIAKKAKQRELERIASGGGDVFFMRNPEDLSGKDGDIILCEFCEEHPPLMNQVGMCTKIKNYYKRKAAKDSGPQGYKYGELAVAHTSPFLGILHPGQCMQALENNMFRAPIYPHKMRVSDFLVIRSRSNYWIRTVNALFTVGQECPLYEVPGPNSKRANNFTRDFLQVFIYRLFWKSNDNPRRIRMDDIKRAFPAHSESSIRKRLKQCADFKRTGMDSNWWVIKPEFRLPSEEEIRAMVSPEQCCAYFSMIAAEQRLKDAGYGEKFLFAPQEDDDEESQLKLDDEVKVAPWNTTRAYIQAMRGKCLLQLTGPADPTGCGEGFSYVRVPNKPTQTKEEQESQPKRTVTGTDADLRRLPLQRAKDLLRKFKVPEEEIRKLTRWEVIDVVRTLSTEKAKAGEQGMDKFSRGNRFSIAEHQERYKEECQRIFDLQNRVLASEEVLSTDEDESSASEESDLEELGKNLENMLSNKKTSTQLSMEREEQERQELLKKIMEEQEGGNSKNGKNKDENAEQQTVNPNQGRILKISRTFKDPEGKEYTRVEIVRRQPVIDAYVKIRTTKDEQFIKQFATLDEQAKEEMKREKRRIQEQLRRIKRNQERERLAQLAQNQKLQPGGMPTSLGDPKTSSSSSHKERDHASHKEISPSRKKFKLKPDLKLKCGACGQVGHMRTNKACPLYTGMQGPTPSLNISVGEEQEEETEREVNVEEDDLVNVDGTKVTLSSKVLKRTLLLKVPKESMGRKKRRMAGDLHCDYLQRHNKTANRRRTDPVVVLSSILEEILNELRSMPDVAPFLFPVNAKLVPDYYRIVTKPMDMQTMREHIRQRRYHSREEFLADLNQIVENSTLYNGARASFTLAAQRMLQSCFDLLAEKEDKLMRLEKAINPLLDDNDQVALSFIFQKLHGEIKSKQESWPFLKPVNKKQVKDYYTVIKRPMDLETIGKNVEAHRYHSRTEFLADIELISTNCEQYNGSESRFTKNAKIIHEFARSKLDEFAEHCAQLEQNIVKVQERARADAELDDAWGAGDDQDYDFHRTSRSSTPDFIDVEGNQSTSSFRSGMAIKTEPGTQPPPQPDVKRGRGRPRKQRDTVEEGNDDIEESCALIEKYKCNIVRCSILGCETTRPPNKLFSLPTNPVQLEKWLKVCQFKTPTKKQDAKKYICYKHFDKKMLPNGRLVQNAVPKGGISSEDMEPILEGEMSSSCSEHTTEKSVILEHVNKNVKEKGMCPSFSAHITEKEIIFENVNIDVKEGRTFSDSSDHSTEGGNIFENVDNNAEEGNIFENVDINVEEKGMCSSRSNHTTDGGNIFENMENNAEGVMSSSRSDHVTEKEIKFENVGINVEEGGMCSSLANHTSEGGNIFENVDHSVEEGGMSSSRSDHVTEKEIIFENVGINVEEGGMCSSLANHTSEGGNIFENVDHSVEEGGMSLSLSENITETGNIFENVDINTGNLSKIPNRIPKCSGCLKLRRNGSIYRKKLLNQQKTIDLYKKKVKELEAKISQIQATHNDLKLKPDEESDQEEFINIPNRHESENCRTDQKNSLLIQHGVSKPTREVLKVNIPSTHNRCIPAKHLSQVKANPNAVKRGRGRPRKDHLASNQNSSQNSFLEEDLQCSTDEEEFQDVSEDENNAASVLDQGERIVQQGQSNSDNISVTSGMTDFIDTSHIKKELKVESPQMENEEEQQTCEDDSQQAAEAMVQLSTVGPYSQQQLEDSMDLDPNYDPSDFLTMHNRMCGDAVNNLNMSSEQQQYLPNPNDDLQDQYATEPASQISNIASNTPGNSENIQQLPLIMPSGVGTGHNVGIDDDLAISESDEEDNGHGHVKVKTEKFNDYGDEEFQAENFNQFQPVNPGEHYVMDVTKGEPELQDQLTQQQLQQPQQQVEDNDDDGWLRF